MDSGSKEGNPHKGKETILSGLIRHCREPGSILNAMLPTLTGALSAISASWALVTPLPVELVLGAVAIVFGIITVRMFMNIA